MNNRLRKAISVTAMSAGMLLGGVGLAWAATVIGTSITLDPGAGIQTGTSAGNTALLRAYDVDGTAYTTFATLTANNTPTMDLAAGVTIGGDTIVSLTGTQTLTNKTLTSPVISSISNTGTLTLPTSTDTLVGRATTDTLTNKTLTSPRIGTSILDTNGNTLVGLSPVGSAVNYLSISNSVATGPITLQAAGSDANISMYVFPKGSGGVVISNGVTNADQFVLAAQTAVTDAGATGTLTTANLSGTRTWTLPDSSGTVTLLGNTVTGTGNIVLASSPSLTTPTLGVATATSVNGLGFTANADGFGIAGGTTSRSFAVTGGNLTLTATGATNVTLPTTGTLVTLAGSEALTNKTLNVDSNTVSNVNGDELDPITVGTSAYGLPIVIPVTVSATADVTVFNPPPFKFRVIDAWALSTSVNSGNWQLTDGTNNITTASPLGAGDNDYTRVGKIDDAYHEVTTSEQLHVITNGSDNANVYIMIMRVD